MKVMKSVMFAALSCTLLALLCSAGASAQTARPQFVYVNDDPSGLPNTVEGFSVDTTTGVLTPLPGSPFPTCSNGCTNNLGSGGGFYVSSKATIRAIHPGTSTNCLYVTNAGSDTFSILNLNAETGIPAAKILGPFTDKGTSGGSAAGMGAAVSPDGKYLYIANGTSDDISADTIGTHCEVTNVAGSPFRILDGGSPDGIMVTGDSRAVLVTEPSKHSVTSYSIGAGGALTRGSITAAAGGAAGIDEDCQSGNIYIGDVSFQVSVEGFSRSGTTLTALAGSPFVFTFSSSNSNGVLVEPDGSHLFVTNQSGGTVTSLAIDPVTGGLTNVPDSPFADGNPLSDRPTTLSISPSGTNLFTGDYNQNGIGAGIGSLLNNNGVLTQAPGSPFTTAPNSVPQAVVAFPTKRVCRE
jgi:DNA-binding beta-propeller fold protein YncE